MVMFGCVGLCRAEYGYVGLCKAMESNLWHILTDGEPLYDAYTTYHIFGMPMLYRLICMPWIK